MVKLVWTTCARKQLKNIKLYYKEMASEKVAMSIILQIQQTAQRLINQPYLGKIEPALINEPEGFRSIIEGNYKIVYWVDGNVIRIITVFDTRQAPDKLRSKPKSPDVRYQGFSIYIQFLTTPHPKPRHSSPVPPVPHCN